MPAALWAALLLDIGGRSNVLTVETSLPVDKVAHFFMYGVLGALGITVAATLVLRYKNQGSSNVV